MKELSVGYCRVSTKKQEQQGLSLDAQEDYIRSWARENGYMSPIKIFKVQESGGDLQRKHLFNTFNYCINNGIKHILITDSDRWTRSREMDVEAQKFIKKHDLSVHILREGKVIGQYGSAVEELFHNVKVDVDEYARKQIREKIISGIEKKLQKCEYPSLPPLGYRSIPKTATSPHKIVQDEKAEKLKKLLELFSTGKYTVAQTVRLAKDIGLNSKLKSEFYKASMTALIKNRFYYGDFEYDNQIYKNMTSDFKPIITKKTWQKNQEVLKHRQINVKEKQGKAFRFNRLITCGKCGRIVFGEKFSHLVKYKTKKGISSKHYNYEPRYHCTKGPFYTAGKKRMIPSEYYNNHVDGEALVIKEDITFFDEETGKTKIWFKKGTNVEVHKCNNPSFLEKEIDHMLTDKLNLIKFNASHWKEVKKVLFQDETKDVLDYEIRRLRSELTKSETRLDSLYEDRVEEVIDAEFFKKKRSEIRDRQQESRDRLSELEEDRKLYDDHTGKTIDILDSLKNWKNILEKADDEKRDQLINLLTIKIFTIYEKTIYKGEATSFKDLSVTFNPEVAELFTLGLLEASNKRHEGMLKKEGSTLSFNSSKSSYSTQYH